MRASPWGIGTVSDMAPCKGAAKGGCRRRSRDVNPKGERRSRVIWNTPRAALAPRHRDSRCFALSRLVTCPIRHRSRKRAGPANRSFDGLSEKGLRFRKWGTYNPLLWSARVLERKPLHVAPMSLCRSTLRPLFAVLLVCTVLAWSLLGEDKPPREEVANHSPAWSQHHALCRESADGSWPFASRTDGSKRSPGAMTAGESPTAI